MKRFERLLVLIIALAAAGGLGYKFQPHFEPVKYIIFSAAILMGSEVFYRMYKYIMYKHLKK